jgi:hypothetical protein
MFNQNPMTPITNTPHNLDVHISIRRESLFVVGWCIVAHPTLTEVDAHLVPAFAVGVTFEERGISTLEVTKGTEGGRTSYCFVGSSVHIVRKSEPIVMTLSRQVSSGIYIGTASSRV